MSPSTASRSGMPLATLMFLAIFYSIMMNGIWIHNAVAQTKQSKNSDAMASALADAITFYYDGNYEAALHLFTELSEEGDDIQIGIWQARALQMTGRQEEAVQQYRSLVDVYPESEAPKIELAELLLSRHLLHEERELLRGVTDDKLPPEWQERLLSLQQETSRASGLAASVYFEQGIEYDSNVTLVPEQTIIVAPEGGVYRLGKSNRKQDDWASTSYLYTRFKYTFADSAISYWDTALSLRYIKYFELDDQDHFRAFLRTGPAYETQRYSYEFPVHYSMHSFTEDMLYHAVGISPQFRYTFSDRFALDSTIRYRKKFYSENRYNNRNSDEIGVDIRPLFTVIPKKLFLKTGIGGFWVDKDEALFSYYGGMVSVSAYYRLNRRISSELGYSYRVRHYQEPQPGWAEDRRDRRNRISLRITGQLTSAISLHTDFGYIHNESNTDLYDYEQYICSVSIGFSF